MEKDMNRVIHFEIHAANPERATKFYADVFGWRSQEWLIDGVKLPEENRYWMVTTGPGNEPGIDGGIVVRRGAAPVEGQAVSSFVCTIGVASVDEYMKKALASGATVAIPKMPIRGVGWLAYCKDTEGNIFGLMSEDKNAA
jgi:uncharacterized protein